VPPGCAPLTGGRVGGRDGDGAGTRDVLRSPPINGSGGTATPIKYRRPATDRSSSRLVVVSEMKSSAMLRLVVLVVVVVALFNQPSSAASQLPAAVSDGGVHDTASGTRGKHTCARVTRSFIHHNRW